jgi:mannonate dehydratase
VEGLTKLRERVESFGIKLDMVPLPMSSAYIARAESPNIMLAKSPERDREIDNVCQIIRNAARVGIPAVKYNLTILGCRPVGRYDWSRWRAAEHFRLRAGEARSSADRGGSGFRRPDVGAHHLFSGSRGAGRGENKVRIACHPHDPGMPRDRGFRGVQRVLGSVDGLKRFISIRENPYHGLNFCQGTVSEMLQNPREEIHDVIRYFGSRRKIFNVHFRNIKGRFLNFQETFPDDGDVDMLRAIRTYKEVGYDGMLMPDHVPKIEGDTGGRQAFAFAFGYIQAAIQMVYG